MTSDQNIVNCNGNFIKFEEKTMGNWLVHMCKSQIFFHLEYLHWMCILFLTARNERAHSATSETVSEQQPTVKFVEDPPEEIELSDQLSVDRMTPFLSTATSLTGWEYALNKKGKIINCYILLWMICFIIVDMDHVDFWF